MSEHPHVVDASEADFGRVVLEESRTRPVVVDFWAPWCGPCRALGPVLEKLADEANGAFLLVKVNTDDNPRISAQYGIRGIPAVKAFVDGALANEFTGALPESAVRQFLKSIVKSPEEQEAKAALELLSQGKRDEADALAKQVLAKDPRAQVAWIVRAEAALARGDLEDAEAFCDQVAEDPDVAALREPLEARLHLVRLVKTSDDEPALRQRVEQDGSPDAALALAAYEALAGKLDEAFERGLSVLTSHGKTHKEAAHKLLLQLIRLVDEERARDLRRRLSIALY